MSGRFRNRRYGGWRSSRFAGRRSFRTNIRSLRSRARGNMRAATQQNDTSDVVINLMTKVKSGVTGATFGGSNNMLGVAALNIYDLLRKSEFFDSYSKMYDQFRVTSIKVKITPVSWKTYNQFNIPSTTTLMKVKTDSGGDDESEYIVPVQTATPMGADDDYGVATNIEDVPDTAENIIVPRPGENDDRAYIDKSDRYIYPQSLTVVTAWDRTGLDSSQLKERIGGNNVADDDKRWSVCIGDNITTYSSAKSTQLVAGANFNCTRYLYPSSQQEKSLYLSTNDLKPQFDLSLSDADYYDIKTATVNGHRVTYANLSEDFITNLVSSPSCPFKPTLLLGILSVDTLTYDQNPQLTAHQINPVLFNLEFDIGVTFRGLRKSQVV